MKQRDLSEALSLVVPMYNESRRATKTVPELVEFVAGLPMGSELLFVDDGSTDDTPLVVETMLSDLDATHARVIRCRHAGKGAAVRAGLSQSVAPLRGFCDIDLATPLDSLRAIASVAESSRVLAIGSRDVIGARVTRHESKLRELLGRTYNRTVQALVTPGLLDTQCGAKVALREVWDLLLRDSHEDGFAWDVEICALADATNIEVIEVPVEWAHDSDSGVNVLTDGIKMLAALPRIRRRARTLAYSKRTDRGMPAWQARTNASLVVGLLRTFASTEGLLIEVCPSNESFAARIGWNPRQLLSFEPTDLALHLEQSDVRASALFIHGLTLEPDTFGLAASALLPDGLLIAESRNAPSRLAIDGLSTAGFAPKMSTCAFSWCSEGEYTTGAGRGSLLLGAIERIVITRLRMRLPRGAVKVMVARRLRNT